MRVYLPVTFRDLDILLDVRELGPAPLDGYAVTEPLAAALAGNGRRPDDEELEFTATEDAAMASLARLVAAPEQPSRRAVLVAELDDDAVRPDPARGDSGVVVDRPVPFRTVRAVHVDDEAAEGAVAAAVRSVDPDRPSAGPEVVHRDTLAAHDLLWYATQEIAFVLGRE